MGERYSVTEVSCHPPSDFALRTGLTPTALPEGREAGGGKRFSALLGVSARCDSWIPCSYWHEDKLGLEGLGSLRAIKVCDLHVKAPRHSPVSCCLPFKGDMLLGLFVAKGFRCVEVTRDSCTADHRCCDQFLPPPPDQPTTLGICSQPKTHFTRGNSASLNCTPAPPAVFPPFPH